MSDLVCLCFEGRDTADHVLADLRVMQKEHVVELRRACTVTRDAGGRLILHHRLVDTVTGYATGGFFLGALVGMLLLNPVGWGLGVASGAAAVVLGAAGGASAGALGGEIVDYSIKDFVKEVSEAVTPDTSALFVLFKTSTLARVLQDFEKFPGKVLRTTLSAEQEEKLRQAVAHHLASAG